ncbi:acetyltransferase-like isoleucine patch superfamily enzyme [Lutibacter sp. Hel_I_33_5]|uniref:acyltransferase n=1 Tax=Lutibacter sp. Hel_I_33_5 TaxID=1566289 RepID=UPI0011AA332D|nr:hypothetical protein [Lutibacter sp. Hel_I_33_5]TVZ56189.1 acetyltransferase-like isoleucine patch superfamily enzyme [Lutibacter sp. Hel_I_33_5]
MKKISTLLICLLPSKIAVLFLKLIGHKVSLGANIGFSFIYVDEIILDKDSRIGHFNFIKTKSIHLKKNSIIGLLNLFKGPFKIFLDEKSIINKNNKFTSGYFPITYGEQLLKLGKGTGITNSNFFDLTNSIIFGEHCQVAGSSSQFWTHGYIHADKGIERIRIDGEIVLGNNVYIGSRCLFNPGVTVADSINIGGNSVISKDLKEPGMYVNQALRYLKINIDNAKQNFKRITTEGLIEEIYSKNKM